MQSSPSNGNHPAEDASPATLLQSLSLDVVAGGVCGGALAVTVARATVPTAWWFVLAGAIWLVYTADHLIDAAGLGPDAANVRHRLHVRQVRTLAVAMVVVGTVTLATAFLALPAPVLLAGAGVGALTLLHLVGARRGFPRWLPKEVSVAAIYAAGIWCGPLALGMPLDAWRWLIAVLHLLAALLYLLLYALYEVPVDEADASPSIARAHGRSAVRLLLDRLTLAGLGVGITGIVGTHALRPEFAALGAVVAAPAMIARANETFAPRGRYRHAEWMFLLLAVPALIR